ncbi:guanylate kinase [Rhodopila sp.]|uniref:guanylate kinase n=1 Tax=Rhodopila sp. TaxID=2480087 RepID=UPI003D0A6BFA
MIEIARRGVCLVLSAPSGAGKTAIADALLASEPQLERSISVTTRARRPAEIDGMHYHFLTEDGFQRALHDNALLEWARVLQGTHAYGTPRAPVERALAAGRDVVFDIDWQGHTQLREKLPADVVSVFVLPPNLMTLRSRLVARAGDRGDEIDRRMRVARDEIRHWVEFDHVVVNENLHFAAEAVRAVLHGARLSAARLTGLPGFVEQLALP